MPKKPYQTTAIDLKLGFNNSFLEKTGTAGHLVRSSQFKVSVCSENCTQAVHLMSW